MNKKILTLLAAGFMGSLSVSAFAANPVFPVNTLHQLSDGSQVLAVLDHNGKDSLAMVTVPTPADVMKDDYKRTLWTITENNVDNNAQPVFTFTNYFTGKVLSLDLSKESGLIAPGNSSWLLTGSNNGTLHAIKNGETYSIKIDAGVVKVVKANSGINFSSIAADTHTSESLKVEQINGLYGTATSLVFDKAMQGNPLAGVPFTAVGANGASEFNIRLTNGQYLVVDTATWDNNVAQGHYWKMTTGDKPAQVTTPATAVDGTTNVLPNGRTENVYKFSMSLNVADGYKITIKPKAVPRYLGATTTSTSDFHYGEVTTLVQNLSVAQFAGGAVVMYASNDVTNANADATAQFGVLSTPNALSENYVYYVQDWNTYLTPTTPNRDGYKRYNYVEDTKTLESKADNALQIPAYMWYLKSGQLKNMSVTSTIPGYPAIPTPPVDGTHQKVYSGPITLINEAEGIYAFGLDTLKLTKGPKLDDAKKMAYREVSAEDLINGALSFRLVSVLANDLYVVENSADKKMVVANGELADALRFKTADSTTVAGFAPEGYGLERPVYALWDRSKSKVLVENNGNFEWSTNTRYPLLVSFYATGVENEYKIVYQKAGVEKAITANAATGILEETDRNNEALVRFQFAKKDAPMYGSPKFGHVQITTLEDDDKMIAPQKDGFAALKAEGQILKSDVYTNDSLKLWLDTAYVREGVNYYYLASTAFTTFNKEDIKRNYLINPANRYAALSTAAQNASGYLFDVVASGKSTYRAAFEPAQRIGEAKDSLAIFEKDTLSASNKYFQPLNPAAVAFEVVVEDGDEVYNIVSKLAEKNTVGTGAGQYDPSQDASDTNKPYATAHEYYLAQLNNVLFWAEDQNLAEKFVINRTTAPTANEAIEAETGVEVIAGQGVVTVQGAAGKVITVSNILGQTIANQVAASDNVTIAAPAGVVVVTVDGEVVKTIVK